MKGVALMAVLLLNCWFWAGEAEKVRKAKAFQAAFIAFLRRTGRDAEATRLSGSGSTAYPGMDEINLIAEFLGGYALLSDQTLNDTRTTCDYCSQNCKAADG